MAEERIPSLPDSPTLKEQGIDAVFYFEPCLYGPPGLPNEIVEKIESAAEKALKDPACISELEKIGMYPAYLPQAEFKKRLLDLDARLYKFARAGGLIPSRLEKKK
jgi:tripartite-type tricarboxylate transporter receptor subunit TctC